jgi:hypothetical protein
MKEKTPRSESSISESQVLKTTTPGQEAWKNAISERDERQLAALFDGEVPAESRAVVASRLSAGGALSDGETRVEQELDELRLLRQGVREWHQQFVLEVQKQQPLDIWSRIEDQIRAEAAARSHRVGFSESLGRFFQQLLQPRALGGLAAVAAAVMLFFSNQHAPVSQDGEPLAVVLPARSERAVSGPSASGSVFASAAGESSEMLSRLAEANSRGSGATLGGTTVFAGNTVSGNAVPDDLLTRVGMGTVSRSSSSRLPMSDVLMSRLMNSPQLIVPNNIPPGGLRAGGTDIDWIKTRNPFKFVPSKDHAHPPVIWIARASRHR